MVLSETHRMCICERNIFPDCALRVEMRNTEFLLEASSDTHSRQFSRHFTIGILAQTISDSNFFDLYEEGKMCLDSWLNFGRDNFN